MNLRRLFVLILLGVLLSVTVVSTASATTVSPMCFPYDPAVPCGVGL